KPFHPRELLARVRSLVRLRQAQQLLAERNALLESTNEELNATMDELKEASGQLVHSERLAAVGELAAGVAHEINNPVNFAMNAARTLSGVVDDVRDFAAPGARDRGPVDVARGLRTTLRLMGHTLMSRGIQVHPDIAEAL